MTASSDPDTYGQLVAYELSGDDAARTGPSTSPATSSREPEISAQITLQNQRGGGSEVRFGDLQLRAHRRRVAVGAPVLRRRAVAVDRRRQGERVPVRRSSPTTAIRRIGSSLREALAELFDGFDTDIGDRMGDVDDNRAGRRRRARSNPTTTPPSRSCSPRPIELFAEAEADLRETATSAPTRRRSTRRATCWRRRSSCCSETS